MKYEILKTLVTSDTRRSMKFRITTEMQAKIYNQWG